MHIFLQIFVREKTLKVPPTKPLVGDDENPEAMGILTKCVEFPEKPWALSFNIHMFYPPCVSASFYKKHLI